MNRYSTLRGGRALAAGVALAGFAGAALAEKTLVEDGDFTLRGGVNGAAAYLDEANTCYGESPEDSYCDWNFVDDRQNRDIRWVDGFVQVSLSGDWAMGDAGRLFGGANAFASATRGAGDTYRLTQNGNEAAADVFYIGWASGETLSGLGTDALKISVGNQRFSIGDGFIIYDGVGDWWRESAFYTAPRRAFRRAAVARLETGPLRSAAFLLGDGGRTRNYIRLAGIDLAYVDDARGTVGVSYIRVRDDSPVEDDRGLTTVSVRAQGNPLTGPGWSSIFLSGEYAAQNGGNRMIDRTKKPAAPASAWYGEAGYTFEDLPWSPYFGYRRIRFSTGYQKLYPGFSRGWGTWFYGEVFTNYFWHTDLRIHMLQARAAPSDSLALTANFYDIDFDTPHGAAMGDRNAAREFNLIADWTINANMGLSPIFGISFPDEGLTRRPDIGDRTATLFGLYAWFSY